MAKPVILYAKAGAIAYDRYSKPYDTATLLIEQYEHGQWKMIENCIEIDVSEGWAIVLEEQEVGFYFGVWMRQVEKRITGLFRITVKGT